MIKATDHQTVGELRAAVESRIAELEPALREFDRLNKALSTVVDDGATAVAVSPRRQRFSTKSHAGRAA